MALLVLSGGAADLAVLSFIALVGSASMNQLVIERNFEVVESQQDDSDVVKSLVCNGVLHHKLHDVAANLVHRLVPLSVVPLGSNPRLFEHFFIRNLIKDSVALIKTKV